MESTGAARTIDATPGKSVMELAKANGVPEIEADCGGACSCASCHVYVDPAWHDRFAARSKIESTLLSMLDVRQPNSRLSCQLKVSEDMDGLLVRTVLST